MEATNCNFNNQLIGIPLPKIDLIKKGVVEALYQAIQGGDDEIKGKAIFWLENLATEESNETLHMN